MSENMTPEQAAAHLGVKTQTLAAWRYRGGGPAFIKLGARLVRYRREDLEAWTASRLHVRTDQPAPAA